MTENHTREIEQLFYRYAYGIDAGDFEGVAQLLKNASIHAVDGNILAQGGLQIKQFYDKIIKIHASTGTPKTQHVVSNILLKSESDGLLKATANYSVFQKVNNDKIEAIICGQYHSSFKPGEHGWEFYQHQTKPLMVGDMTNHLNVSIKDIGGKTNKALK
jgi:3-phenylpropionate/cinnamic acid dioxygenase small subunit